MARRHDQNARQSAVRRQNGLEDTRPVILRVLASKKTAYNGKKVLFKFGRNFEFSEISPIFSCILLKEFL